MPRRKSISEASAALSLRPLEALRTGVSSERECAVWGQLSFCPATDTNDSCLSGPHAAGQTIMGEDLGQG